MQQLREAVILIFDHKMEIKDWLKKKPTGASNSPDHCYNRHNYRNTRKLDVFNVGVFVGTFFFRDLYSELEIINISMLIAEVNPL